MPVFEAETYIDAPLEEVWDFHSGVNGLVELTPEWMGLTVESTTGPDGEPDPEVLDEGSVVEVSLEPLGVLPRFSWRSVILERGYDDEGGEAWFVDEMEDGPFDRWRHTHSFRREGEGTVVSDTVEYDLPVWMLGRAGSPFFRLNARRMFAHRHARTRELLEGEDGGDEGRTD